MSQVFVVDRADFFGGDWPQGFVRIPDGDATGFLSRALSRGRFVERALAEANPAWKQWIPYCALRCGAGGGEPGILAVQRTGGQSEARLHGSWSVGLGGHIEPVDQHQLRGPEGLLTEPVEATGFFAAALRRELTEELTLTEDMFSEARLTWLGLINDDSTAVGQVHAGLAYCLDLDGPLPAARQRVGIREISKMRGGFTSLVEFAELWQDPARFESWSRFFIDAGIFAAMGNKPLSGAGSAQAGATPGAAPHDDPPLP